MDTKATSPKIRVAPRGWTMERATKVAAIEGLTLTPRMTLAIAPRGDEARRNIRAVSKKS